MPTAKIANSASSDASAPCSGRGRPSAPPRWRSSTDEQRERRVRARDLDERVDRLGGQARRAASPSPVPGTGWSGSMCRWRAAATGHRRDRVHRRPERAQRREQRVGLGRVAEVDRLDDDERLAAQRLGDLRDRREVEDAPDRRHLVGHAAASQLAPGVQHLAAALDRAPQDRRRRPRSIGNSRARSRSRRRSAAAAAQRPEQVGLVVGGRRGRARRRRSRARSPSRCWPPGRACGRGPARSAAERVADDADVRRGAGERGEPVLGRGGDDVHATARRPRRARLRAAGRSSTPRMRSVRSRIVSSEVAERRRRCGRCPGRRRAGRARAA